MIDVLGRKAKILEAIVQGIISKVVGKTIKIHSKRSGLIISRKSLRVLGKQKAIDNVKNIQYEGKKIQLNSGFVVYSHWEDELFNFRTYGSVRRLKYTKRTMKIVFVDIWKVKDYL